jgi:hypothetical protein
VSSPWETDRVKKWLDPHGRQHRGARCYPCLPANRRPSPSPPSPICRDVSLFSPAPYPYLPAHTARSLRGTHASRSLLDYRGTEPGTRTNSTGRFLPRDLGRMAAGDDGGAGIDWESLAEATSGAVGSLVSTTVFYPLDTCKSKFQAELQSQQGAAHKYRCGSFPSFLHSLPLVGWLSGWRRGPAALSSTEDP